MRPQRTGESLYFGEDSSAQSSQSRGRTRKMKDHEERWTGFQATKPGPVPDWAKDPTLLPKRPPGAR